MDAENAAGVNAEKFSGVKAESASGVKTDESIFLTPNEKKVTAKKYRMKRA